MFSVIIPAYNSETFIKRAVNSVLKQTLQNFEILIIDDKSSDGTVQLAQDMASKDNRIRVFLQDTNGGPAVSRNVGIDNAKGEWIAILDADDAYKPERLEKMLKVAEDGNYDLLCDSIIEYDIGIQKEVGIALDLERDVNSFSFLDLVENDYPGIAYPYGGVQPIFRRDFLNKYNLRYCPDYRFGEDFLFYMEVLSYAPKAALLKKGYYIYTKSVGPVSGRRSSHSRTVADTHQIISAMEYFVEKHGERIEPQERLAIRERMKKFSKHTKVDELREILADKNIFHAFFFLIKTPYVVRYILKKLFKKIRNKRKYYLHSS